MQQKLAEAAFNKIIKHGPSSSLRKAAEKYWSACSSEGVADESVSVAFENAVKSIPIDYRKPALECLDACILCKENNDNSVDCYYQLAVCLADRIVHVM